MSTNKELREGVAGKAKTCFLYVRVSTKMQVENGESIEAQLYDLRDYAKRNNLRILYEYIDDGYSGKNITGRPHFQEMMEEIKSGVRADYVLVFKLSRLGVTQQTHFRRFSLCRITEQTSSASRMASTAKPRWAR